MSFELVLSIIELLVMGAWCILYALWLKELLKENRELEFTTGMLGAEIDLLKREVSMLQEDQDFWKKLAVQQAQEITGNPEEEDFENIL